MLLLAVPSYLSEDVPAIKMISSPQINLTQQTFLNKHWSFCFRSFLRASRVA